jgi:hypothetical protein
MVKDWTLSAAIEGAYATGVILLGVAATLAVAWQPGDPEWVPFSVLLLMACATTPLTVTLPGGGRTLSLSFRFIFAAIVELPPSAAFYVAAVAMVFEILVDENPVLPWDVIAFNVASLVLSLYCTSFVYARLTAESWLEWTVAAWAAAVTYYAVLTVSRSLRIAIKEWTSPWKVWQQRFFWIGPVYMLAPVGLGAVKAVIHCLFTRLTLIKLQILLTPVLILIWPLF